MTYMGKNETMNKKKDYFYTVILVILSVCLQARLQLIQV